MRISSGRKTLLLVGILAVCGAAFLYLDPLELDLLGLQQHAVVTKPAPAPHPAAPAAHPLAPATAAAPANVAASSVLPFGAGAPQAMNAAHPTVVVQHASVPAETPSTAVPVTPATAPVAAPAEVAQPATPAKPVKTAKKTAPAKRSIPRDADLRHCLDLDTDAAIAKCAGE